MLSSEHGYDGHRKKSRKPPGTYEYQVCNVWKLTRIFHPEEHVLLLFSSDIIVYEIFSCGFHFHFLEYLFVANFFILNYCQAKYFFMVMLSVTVVLEASV